MRVFYFLLLSSFLLFILTHYFTAQLKNYSQHATPVWKIRISERGKMLCHIMVHNYYYCMHLQGIWMRTLAIVCIKQEEFLAESFFFNSSLVSFLFIALSWVCVCLCVWRLYTGTYRCIFLSCLFGAACAHTHSHMYANAFHIDHRKIIYCHQYKHTHIQSVSHRSISFYQVSI